MEQVIPAKAQKILNHVLDYLAVEKKRLNMGSWGDYDDCDISDEERPSCNTTSCIAGTVLLTTTKGREFLKHAGFFDAKRDKVYYTFPRETPSVAQEILGITDEQAERLFYFDSWSQSGLGWPSNREEKYLAAKTPAGRFAVTKARIRSFFKTGL